MPMRMLRYFGSCGSAWPFTSLFTALPWTRSESIRSHSAASLVSTAPPSP